MNIVIPPFMMYQQQISRLRFSTQNEANEFTILWTAFIVICAAISFFLFSERGERVMEKVYCFISKLFKTGSSK